MSSLTVENDLDEVALLLALVELGDDDADVRQAAMTKLATAQLVSMSPVLALAVVRRRVYATDTLNKSTLRSLMNRHRAFFRPITSLLRHHALNYEGRRIGLRRAIHLTEVHDKVGRKDGHRIALLSCDNGWDERESLMQSPNELFEISDEWWFTDMVRCLSDADERIREAAAKQLDSVANPNLSPDLVKTVAAIAMASPTGSAVARLASKYEPIVAPFVAELKEHASQRSYLGGQIGINAAIVDKGAEMIGRDLRSTIAGVQLLVTNLEATANLPLCSRSRVADGISKTLVVDPEEASIYSSQMIDVLQTLDQPGIRHTQERARLWDVGITSVDIKNILSRGLVKRRAWQTIPCESAEIYELLLPTAKLIMKNSNIPETAEDIVERFIVQCPKWSERLPEWVDNKESWLCFAKSKLRYIAKDQFKYYGRDKRAGEVDSDAVADNATFEDDPSRRSLQLEQSAAVDRAMEGLPDKQRQVAKLKYFEGMTATEIAEALKVPPGTVWSTLNRAICKLRNSKLLQQ